MRAVNSLEIKGVSIFWLKKRGNLCAPPSVMPRALFIPLHVLQLRSDSFDFENNPSYASRGIGSCVGPRRDSWAYRFELIFRFTATLKNMIKLPSYVGGINGKRT